MPEDAETDAYVLSQDAEGQVTVRIGDDVFNADPNWVVIDLNGCRLSVRSYNAHSFCDGKPWPAP